ncbi:MAG: hypothetical protein ACTSYH_03635 [Candidatus Heimdallarchaeaceae archaeon]
MNKRDKINTLINRLAMNSSWWNSRKKAITEPEGRMLFAIIEQAAQNLSNLEPDLLLRINDPKAWIEKRKKYWRQNKLKKMEKLLEIQKSYEFIFKGNKINTVASMLDLDPDWIRKTIKIWMNNLH